MPDRIRACDNKNKPLIDASHPLLSLTYFNLVSLAKGQSYACTLPKHESVYVVLSGTCDITAAGESFTSVGSRKDIWSGKADSIYAPAGAAVTVTALTDRAALAVAGGICDDKFDPFRVTPDEVEMVEVGSPETHSRRRIFHILGHNARGRAGNLLVSELYADGGCWSGYPPHKHDTDEKHGPALEETAFEEVYYFRFNPENGFGGQFIFDDNGNETLYMTRSGDTVIIEGGYHPTVTSPNHEEYIFTILVGKTQRSLIQNFKPEYRHIMDKIPGIGAMRDKFKQD